MTAAPHLTIVPDPTDVVDTTEAAAILGITANGVRDLVRRGTIPGIRDGRRWLYPAAAVNERAAIQSGTQQAPMPGGQYGSNVSHLDEHCRWMMRAGRAARTVKVRRMHMQFLVDYLGRDPVDATQLELEAWQDTQPIDQLRFKTAVIRPYFDWLHKRGIRADNPAALLVTPKAKRGLPRPISFESLERAIRTAPTPRLQAWLILAAYGGLRAKEIAHLEMACFEPNEWGGMFLRLTRTKGEHARVSALPAWAWELIKPALAPDGLCFRRERGSGPVTPQQVSQLSNDWLHKSGTGSTLHTLRHWAGSSGIGVEDVRVVQDFLGHASPTTTAIYTAVQPRRIAEMVNTFRRPDLSRRCPTQR